jgi:hypothetical protein
VCKLGKKIRGLQLIFHFGLGASTPTTTMVASPLMSVVCTCDKQIEIVICCRLLTLIGA